MYISVQRVMESYSVAGEVEKVFCAQMALFKENGVSQNIFFKE